MSMWKRVMSREVKGILIVEDLKVLKAVLSISY